MTDLEYRKLLQTDRRTKDYKIVVGRYTLADLHFQSYFNRAYPTWTHSRPHGIRS